MEFTGQAHAGTLAAALFGAFRGIGMDRGIDQGQLHHTLRRDAQDLLGDEATQ
ncbi:hypothetical protein D3C75_1279030 [compost metagenome]